MQVQVQRWIKETFQSLPGELMFSLTLEVTQQIFPALTCKSSIVESKITSPRCKPHWRYKPWEKKNNIHFVWCALQNWWFFLVLFFKEQRFPKILKQQPIHFQQQQWISWFLAFQSYWCKAKMTLKQLPVLANF